MKESAFQKWIVDVANANGWRVWHVPTPMRPIGGNKFVPDARGRGLPDLLMLHDDPPRIIFAEVKGTGGVLSDEQREFLRLARGIGESTILVSAYTWRPGNEDLIEATLKSKVLA